MSISFFKTLIFKLNAKIMDTRGLTLGYIAKILYRAKQGIAVEYFNIHLSARFFLVLRPNLTKVTKFGIIMLNW